MEISSKFNEKFEKILFSRIPISIRSAEVRAADELAEDGGLGFHAFGEQRARYDAKKSRKTLLGPSKRGSKSRKIGAC